MIVLGLHLAVPWVCLQFVIVVFPDRTHYFFLYKWGLVVRIHFICLLLPRKPILCFSNSTWLFTGWRQYWVRHSTGVTDWVGVYVNISPLEEWLKISSKISGNVALSYQVNLAVDIPNIFARFTCRHWLSAMLTTRCWEVFFACGALAASICVGIVIPSTWLSIYITYC